MYAACALSDSTPASKVSVVSTPWVELGGAERPHLAYAAPRLELALELLGEDPPVPGVAHRVEHGPADGDVVGLVEVAPAPGVAEVPGDHDVGTVPADLGGEQPAHGHAVLEDAVGLAQEVDRVDADDARRLDLLGLADDAALVGRHAVDAGLAAGDHRVADPLALAGPAGDGGCGAELHVVGVRHDAQRALPGLVERLERWGHRGASMGRTYAGRASPGESISAGG